MKKISKGSNKGIQVQNLQPKILKEVGCQCTILNPKHCNTREHEDMEWYDHTDSGDNGTESDDEDWIPERQSDTDEDDDDARTIEDDRSRFLEEL